MESLRKVWDNMKHNKIHIKRVPEGEESKQGIENLFERIMAENVPHLVKEKLPKSRKHKESSKDES